MELSRNWLAEYVQLPDSLDELVGRLTLAGFAVEGIEERGDDAILDLEITTNRPDCMNHLGLAREVAVLTGAALRPPEPRLEPADREAASVTAVEIADTTDCPRYVAMVVRGIELGSSPQWLERRLEAVGVRPINVVVDVTNFVLWEMGQPLHAFDLATLSGSRIVVRRAREGERLTTLDGEERRLDPGLLVIADAERPVALAGVMGGEETEVTAGTTDILIESAHFDPPLVRRAARALGMHTDASHRFERGADPEICRRAAVRAAALIAELAGGEVLGGAIDVLAEPWDWELGGRLEAARLDAFVGQPIPADEVERNLRGLGFGLTPDGPGAWRVTVPSWRYYDFSPVPGRRPPPGDGPPEVYEADLFEEVVRLHGYERVEPTLPAIAGPDEGASPEHDRRLRVRDRLAACGYAEAVSYGFYSYAEDGRFPVVGESPTELANPLSERYAVLRRSLLPGLVASAGFNLRRGAEAVRLFEVGHLFPGGGEDEIEVIGLVAGGVLGEPWDRRRELDLFDLKGAVESLAGAFAVLLDVRPRELPGFVPGTAADLLVDGEPAGHIGQVDDPDSPVDLFAAQLAAARLGTAPAARPVELPSRYPGIAVDLTLTHPDAVSWAAIGAAIGELADPRLESWGLKDRYRGEGVPEGAVNTTVFFFYGSAERSLTQDEVNEAHEELRSALEERFGWSAGGDAEPEVTR